MLLSLAQPSGKNVTLTAQVQNGQVFLSGTGPPDNFNVTSYVMKVWKQTCVCFMIYYEMISVIVGKYNHH